MTVAKTGRRIERSERTTLLSGRGRRRGLALLCGPASERVAAVCRTADGFELAEVEGTMLGFRFPDYAEGLEVGGYHLHFIDAERRLGGHVLGSHSQGLRVRLDPSSELHVELPPEVNLADPDLAASTHAAVELVERAG